MVKFTLVVLSWGEGGGSVGRGGKVEASRALPGVRRERGCGVPWRWAPACVRVGLCGDSGAAIGTGQQGDTLEGQGDRVGCWLVLWGWHHLRQSPCSQGDSSSCVLGSQARA